MPTQHNPHFETMLAKAKSAKANAYAPYSQFCVGVCLRSIDNTCFSGCNVENGSYGLTLCAECVAIGEMVKAGQQRIAEVLLIGTGNSICPPCGRCRQLIFEFAKDDDVLIHLVNGETDTLEDSYTIAELLPVSFKLAKQELKK